MRKNKILLKRADNFSFETQKPFRVQVWETTKSVWLRNYPIGSIVYLAYQVASFVVHYAGEIVRN